GKSRKIAGLDDALYHLAFSPDSKQLAVVRNTRVCVFDTANLKEVWESAPHENDFVTLAFAPDGRTLAAAGFRGVISVWETTRWTSLSPFGGHLGKVAAVRAIDEKTLVTVGGDGTVRRWNALTGEEQGRFTVPTSTDDWVKYALAPDGKTVAVVENTIDPNTGDMKAEHVRMYNSVTGQERRRLPLSGRPVFRLLYSPDGKMLACADTTTVNVFDAATGKSRHQLRPEIDGVLGDGPQALDVVFSPDGRRLAIGIQDPRVNDIRSEVQVFELATGKRRSHWLGEFQFRYQFQLPMIIAPGSRVLISSDNNMVLFRDVRTGKEVRRLAVGNELTAMAISGDGKLLAGGQADGQIFIWDTSNGTVLSQAARHPSAIATLNFSADNRRLLSGSQDSTALVWDVPLLVAQAALPKLTKQQLDIHWQELGDSDAEKADRAIFRLLDAPEQSIPYLKNKLRPAVLKADEAAIAKLVGELDSNDFDTRERATQALRELEGAARPALEKAVQDEDLGLEARKRAQKLLDQLTGENVGPDQVRLLRAIEIVEQAGSDEAFQLLEALAKGTPGAKQTIEARLALERLRKLRP
ncbi:MAG: PQQ-binding-like beta-propeller repeat protein, partial [Gemmataceae bacterium]